MEASKKQTHKVDPFSIFTHVVNKNKFIKIDDFSERYIKYDIKGDPVVTNASTYEFFCNMNPTMEIAVKGSAIHKKILTKIFRKIWHHMVYDSAKILLPFSLGTINIVSFPLKYYWSYYLSRFIYNDKTNFLSFRIDYKVKNYGNLSNYVRIYSKEGPINLKNYIYKIRTTFLDPLLNTFSGPIDYSLARVKDIEFYDKIKSNE